MQKVQKIMPCKLIGIRVIALLTAGSFLRYKKREMFQFQIRKKEGSHK
jgi:hypothetical protein